MRAKPRSVWQTEGSPPGKLTDTRCANVRDGRVLDARKALQVGGEQTSVAAGHGSEADVYDSGVGSAKPEACKA